MRVGFVGTGVMGNLMARSLLEAGHELTVHDIRRDAADQLCGAGAHWGESPKDTAQASQVVFTSLPGPEEVEKAVLDPDTGILAGLQPKSGYIDMTTNTVSCFLKVAAACRDRGVDALDAPVSRRAPNLTIMVGGDPGTFARYKKLLEDISESIFYMGEAGKGMVAKSINQFLICASFLVGAEGLLLGAKAGLDVDTLYRALDVSQAGRVVRLDPFPNVVFKGEFRRGHAPGGALKRWVKDMGCASETARSIEGPSAFLNIVEDVLRRARELGLGDNTWYAAVKALEAMEGIELRVPAGGGEGNDPLG